MTTSLLNLEVEKTEQESDEDIGHWVCGVCYPTDVPPMFSLCGDLMDGTEESDCLPDCQKCYYTDYCPTCGGYFA